jgi:hypothetical protein
MARLNLWSRWISTELEGNGRGKLCGSYNMCMYTTHYNILRIYLLCTDLTAPWLEPSGAGVSRAAATLMSL